MYILPSFFANVARVEETLFIMHGEGFSVDCNSKHSSYAYTKTCYINFICMQQYLRKSKTLGLYIRCFNVHNIDLPSPCTLVGQSSGTPPFARPTGLRFATPRNSPASMPLPCRVPPPIPTRWVTWGILHIPAVPAAAKPCISVLATVPASATNIHRSCDLNSRQITNLSSIVPVIIPSHIHTRIHGKHICIQAAAAVRSTAASEIGTS
jgi:hypothetical protein